MYACLYRPPAPEAPIASSGAAALVDLARDFSPRFERHGDDLVSLDIAGLERLLGPPRAIAGELRRDAARRQLRVHVAVAATRTSAIVLALARPGLTVVDTPAAAAVLASVPLAVLETISACGVVHGANESVADDVATFRGWGLKTLGDLAALPSADLAARLGMRGLVWQAVARGDDGRPLVPTTMEEAFEASLDLEWPIEGLEPLSFVLTRLLEPLSTRLERRDRGAAVLYVRMRLVTKAAHERRLELPTPIRDVRTLRTLALLDLESHPPSAAIDRVTVAIDPTPGRVLQHTLFTRARAAPEQLSTLLARLGALMGQDRLGAAATIDSYRPGAFEMRRFDVGERAGEAGRAGGSPVQPLVSALRRCREPVPARVVSAGDRPVRVTTDRRGFAGGAVVQAAGPWRTSGDWWAGRVGTFPPVQPVPPIRPSWNRDEWDVALSDGAMYRVFRDRDTDAWFIDGVVD